MNGENGLFLKHASDFGKLKCMFDSDNIDYGKNELKRSEDVV